MLVLANGSPWVVARLLHQAGNRPVDGGRVWRDGRPVLGPSKTWRGLVAGTVSCLLLSCVVGLGWLFRCVIGLLARLGCLVSSFIKRRKGLETSARAL